MTKLTARYTCYKRRDDTSNEPTVWRAIQYSPHQHKQIELLTQRKWGKENFGVSTKELLRAVFDGEWIVEHPYDKDEHGNIEYYILPNKEFERRFIFSDPGPGILNGGRCVCKNNDK